MWPGGELCVWPGNGIFLWPNSVLSVLQCAELSVWPGCSLCVFGRAVGCMSGRSGCAILWLVCGEPGGGLCHSMAWRRAVCVVDRAVGCAWVREVRVGCVHRAAAAVDCRGGGGGVHCWSY